MYECLECGTEFEIPNTTEVEAGTGYNVDTCPGCGSTDINEVDDYTDDDYWDAICGEAGK